MLNGKVDDDSNAAEKVYQPNTPDAESRMRTEVDQLLNDRKHQNTEVTARIETDDSLQCVGNLKPNKTAGIDRIVGEHVINTNGILSSTP